MKSHRRRVCILSGGGDAPGVNAAIRAFVHASNGLSLEVYGARFGFEGLLATDGIVPLEVRDVAGILPRGGAFLGCSTAINPFFMKAESGETYDAGRSIVERLQSKGIECLVLIGGDGTMLAAERFIEHGMPCVGIPKTIDNDLGETDYTIGFDTAVGTATHAIDSLHSTAEAHARVLVVEVMGRNAGWIALHAGIAGGADVILLPEIPYDLNRVVSKIRERESLGRRFSIVVIAEGAKPIGGDMLRVEEGTPGHLPRLGGAGERLARALDNQCLGHQVRVTVLGLLQRGGAPTAHDRVAATQMGVMAAELCDAGKYCRMVAWRGGMLTSVDLARQDFLHKDVDIRGRLVRTARSIGIELGAETGEAL